MIHPLKIVVCSLKSVKLLPGVQIDSPVMNTPASHNSPLVNTLRSLDSPMMNPNVEDELNATDDTVPRGLHIALVGGDKNNPKGLDGGRNIKSRLPCDEYTGKSTS